MNTKQRRLILFGIVVMVLMGLFPPWTETTWRHGAGHFQQPAGYDLIFAPSRTADGLKIDFVRLLVQWIVTALLVGGRMFYLKDSDGSHSRGPGAVEVTGKPWRSLVLMGGGALLLSAALVAWLFSGPAREATTRSTAGHSGPGLPADAIPLRGRGVPADSIPLESAEPTNRPRRSSKGTGLPADAIPLQSTAGDLEGNSTPAEKKAAAEANRLLANLRAKYPGAYDDWSDQELARSLAAKYPVYAPIFAAAELEATKAAATASKAARRQTPPPP